MDRDFASMHCTSLVFPEEPQINAPNPCYVTAPAVETETQPERLGGTRIYPSKRARLPNIPDPMMRVESVVMWPS